MCFHPHASTLTNAWSKDKENATTQGCCNVHTAQFILVPFMITSPGSDAFFPMGCLPPHPAMMLARGIHEGLGNGILLL